MSVVAHSVRVWISLLHPISNRAHRLDVSKLLELTTNFAVIDGLVSRRVFQCDQEGSLELLFKRKVYSTSSPNTGVIQTYLIPLLVPAAAIIAR